MTFTRFVQVGRVALVSYGPDAGKLCTIIDVVDNNRVLVDGPKNLTGVQRGTLPIRWITLTDFTIDIQRSVTSKVLSKAFVKADIQAKWGKTAWAQRLERQQKRSRTTDFDRFQVMVARKQRSAIIRGFKSRIPKAK